MDIDLDLSLTIGLIVLAFVLLGGLIVYYNFRRQWFDHLFQERRVRQEQYRNIIYFLSQANQKMDEESHLQLIATLDSSILSASPHIVLQLIEFQKFLTSANLRVLKNSDYWLEEREQMAKKLMSDLRYDLYGPEPIVEESLSRWQPFTRVARKPSDPPFEVISFPPTGSKPFENQSQQQK